MNRHSVDTSLQAVATTARHASTSMAPKVSWFFCSTYYHRNFTCPPWHRDWILSSWCSECFRGDPFSRCVYSHSNRTVFSAVVIIPYMARFGHLQVLSVLAFFPRRVREIQLIPLRPQFLALTPMNWASWLTIHNTQSIRIHINLGSTLKMYRL